MRTAGIQAHTWKDLPVDQVSPTFSRQFVSGRDVMIAKVMLAKGAIVPKHSHVHEQISYVTEGALRFALGEAGADEVTVSAGGVIVFPSNVPHAAVVLEDSVVLDVFSPPREDWINKTDAYLRR
jgi:quercetin dioxygenase-like cupin family protein